VGGGVAGEGSGTVADQQVRGSGTYPEVEGQSGGEVDVREKPTEATAVQLVRVSNPFANASMPRNGPSNMIEA